MTHIFQFQHWVSFTPGPLYSRVRKHDIGGPLLWGRVQSFVAAGNRRSMTSKHIFITTSCERAYPLRVIRNAVSGHVNCGL